MKKIVSTFLLFIMLFLSVDFWYSESCKYMSKWEECIYANNNWNPLSIDPETNFLCRSTNNNEEMLYNIILDEEFKVIDKDANLLLEALEENKNYYFWSDKKESFLKWIDDVEKYFWKTWVFHKEYLEICEKVWIEWISCIKEKTWRGASNNTITELMLKWECESLANTKLVVRRDVAYDTLMLNKQAVRRDEIKKYEQIQRTQYESIFDLMTINLWYWLRIAQKWPSKTKNPHK